ncbi:c-type cytochrome domain-containing protein [Maribacter sp. 2210JD10-5]|uniref:c-type cytochrome domain-containing protein n=1 Tax=Maribacter sp. 2210JD10-5 TaxID=3386272 RepID=UPI0039BCBE52
MIHFLAFDFSNFIGRFHPLFVHLPIGFIILAVLMEWYQRLKKKDKLSSLISYAWLLAGIGGAFAAFCGWYLGETGLYFEDDLFLHRWIGIAIVILSFLGWWLKKSPEKYSNVVHQTANIIIIALISFEGHLGGNLTHGEEYLFEFAPEGIRNMMLSENTEETDLSKADSVFVYNDLVMPIFKQKCFACHDNNVQRGGLNMASIDSMLVGGDGGPAYLAGNVGESELFRRITLPQKNIKFMPPVGDPLTYDEIKIVEWWIGTGAASDATIKNIEVTENIKPTLLRKYQLDTDPKPHYEMVNIDPVDVKILDDLTNAGFTVKTLGPDNPLLDIEYNSKGLDENKLQLLQNVSQHVTWLSFAESDITNEGLNLISGFSNLTRLQLEKTAIGDAGMQHLTGLKHLEALNLYGTNITNASLEYIQNIESLKRVYTWQTNVTEEGIEQLREKEIQAKVVM